jgi:hypothetical protein
VGKTPRFRRTDFFNRFSAGFYPTVFGIFAKKFLEKGAFFFASFLLGGKRNEGQVKNQLFGLSV